MLVTKFERGCDRMREVVAHPYAVLVVPVVLVVWRLILSSPADPDLFARVSMGRLVEKLRRVPLEDPFAFTEKLPVWIDHEWLSGVVFYQVAMVCGDAGLIALKLAIAAWTILLLARAALAYAPHRASRVVWVAICALEASYLWGSTIRSQVFTYLFVALTFYAFVQYRRAGICRYLMLLPPFSVALVNMHGGYALVVVVLWLFTASSLLSGERWRLLAIVSILVTLASLATPYGPAPFVTYLIHAIAMKRPTITEWEPLYRHPMSFIRTILIAAPLAVGMVVAGRRGGRDLTALVILAFAFYCGVSHIRFLGFAMITAMVFGGGYVGVAVEALRKRVRTVTFDRASVIVGAAMLGAVLLQTIGVSMQIKTWRLGMQGYPIAATEWLRRSGATGRLLVDFNNGSYAQWRLYPRFLVSMDGRYEEVYTNETVEQVSLAFSPHTPQGAAALQAIDPTHILFAASVDTARAQAALSDGWREVYRDSQYAISSRIESHPVPADLSDGANLWQALF